MTVPTERTHLCRAGRACRDRWRDDAGLWLGRLTERANTLCGGCWHALQVAVGKLWHDYGQLERAVGDSSAGPGVKVDLTPVSPVPINLQGDALQRSIVETVELAAAIATSRTPLEHSGPASPRVGEALDVIEAHLDDLVSASRREVYRWSDDGCYRGRALVDGPGLALELIRLHALTQAHLGLTTKRWRLDAPCPRCERAELGREDSEAGGSQVDCAHCGHTMTEADYRRQVLGVVDRPGAAPFPARPRRIPSKLAERYHPEFGVGR